MSSKFITREYRIYLAIWRKALLHPEETISIKLPTYNLALTTRMGMYRAIRPFREGTLFDDELALAAERYVLFCPKPDDVNTQAKVILRPRLTLEALEAQLGDFNFTEDDLLLLDERIAAHELTELVKPLHKANAFYNREEE